MRLVSKKFASLLLILCFVQNIFALEHEFSEKHFTDCEHSICINPTVLDDSLIDIVTLEFKGKSLQCAISIRLCNQLANQAFHIAPPPRAPPK